MTEFCHVDIREHFMRELKEEGLVLIKWIDGDNNDVDILARIPQAVFNGHFPLHAAKDKYMDAQT